MGVFCFFQVFRIRCLWTFLKKKDVMLRQNRHCQHAEGLKAADKGLNARVIKMKC